MKQLLTFLFLITTSQFALADSGAGGSGEPDPVPHHVKYLVKDQQYGQAIKKLKYFVRKEKESVEGWRLLAHSQLQAKQFDASLKSHNKALKLDATDLETNHSLGLLFIAMNDKTQATSQLQKLKSFCGECEYYSSLDKSLQSALGS